MYDTTSPMRQSLCAAICGTVHRADRSRKQWLADTLTAMPFEQMGDEALVQCAYDAGVDPAEVGRIVSEVSAERHAVNTRGFLCGVCCDSHLVPAVDGGWRQCPRCTVPHLVEPAI